MIFPASWGLLGGIVTYQHSFSGDESAPAAQLLTVQPIIHYNLPDGFYLRSTGLWNFDFSNHVSNIPIGFGFGKVWSLLGGNTVNAYVEPQYSVYRHGAGAPIWQVFAGINFQFANAGR